MRKFDSINVIPFIDIMLVLLAIVLTTATFINNGQLDIKLPEASSESGSSDLQRMEVAIYKNDAIFLDGVPKTLDELRASLAIVDKDSAVLLRVDESVPFNRFISVIDLLKILELDKVSVATRTSSAGEAVNDEDGDPVAQ